MTFALLKLAELLLRPSTLLLLAAVAGFLLLGRAPRIGRILIGVSLAVQVAVMLLPIDQWLLRPLEERYPMLRRPPAHVTGIITLGGAVDTTTTAARGVPSLNDAAERMTDFVARARQYPDAVLAFAGGSGEVLRGQLSEADVARDLFNQLGLGDRTITYESRSRTTRENAINLAGLLHPGPDQRWLLITSAAHMPRAAAEFRAAGWTVIPDPVGYKTAHGLAADLPGALPDRLERIDNAVHEWLGLAAMAVRNRV
jgi:uncharacterized SAM-binding protein YcdF (DUF218 family)